MFLGVKGLNMTKSLYDASDYNIYKNSRVTSFYLSLSLQFTNYVTVDF